MWENKHFEGRKFTLNVEHQLVASAENICIHPPSALPKLPGMPQEVTPNIKKTKRIEILATKQQRISQHLQFSEL